MLQGTNNLILENRNEEIQFQINDENRMVKVQSQDELSAEHKMVVAHQKKELATTTNPQTTLVFNHDTVAYVASGASTVGGAVGGFLGSALSPDLAQHASNAVREAIKDKGDEIADKILKDTGLNKIPGGGLLIKNQVTDIAHAAGETTYNNVKSELTTRGAMMGGATAGAMTVALMEGINLGSYLYSSYVTPYFAARRERADAIESQRQFQLELSNKEIDMSPVELDDEFDFVIVKKPGA